MKNVLSDSLMKTNRLNVTNVFNENKYLVSGFIIRYCIIYFAEFYGPDGIGARLY